jgi:hypothetical protein
MTDPIDRAPFYHDGGLPRMYRRTRSFRDPGTSRRHRNGKAGITSKTCSRSTIRIGSARYKQVQECCGQPLGEGVGFDRCRANAVRVR